MSAKTGIEWTDATWNPTRGCSRVSEGCRNCYAEKMAGRFAGPGQPYEGLAKRVGGKPQWTGRVDFIEEHLADPIRWQQPRRIFVDSMSDLFHEDLDPILIDRVFAVMALTGRHTYQILTKRPLKMRNYVQRSAWTRIARQVELWADAYKTGRSGVEYFARHARANGFGKLWPEWPLANVHLGVSVEDQTAADQRIPILLQTPAAVRWISAEPLLGPLDLLNVYLWDEGYLDDGSFVPPLNWVVVGGESGPGHRPMEISWVESIVNQCRENEVPVFVKQDSGARAGQQGRIPDALWIKEMPR